MSKWLYQSSIKSTSSPLLAPHFIECMCTLSIVCVFLIVFGPVMVWLKASVKCINENTGCWNIVVPVKAKLLSECSSGHISTLIYPVESVCHITSTLVGEWPKAEQWPSSCFFPPFVLYCSLIHMQKAFGRVKLSWMWRDRGHSNVHALGWYLHSLLVMRFLVMVISQSCY